MSTVAVQWREASGNLVVAYKGEEVEVYGPTGWHRVQTFRFKGIRFVRTFTERCRPIRPCLSIAIFKFGDAATEPQAVI
ncbi:MAG: hypothetical protein N2116_02045 [Armatimonadetes bacterium]|nr:hypothetical protein [Armatimonadota bacterium]